MYTLVAPPPLLSRNWISRSGHFSGPELNQLIAQFSPQAGTPGILDRQCFLLTYPRLPEPWSTLANRSEGLDEPAQGDVGGKSSLKKQILSLLDHQIAEVRQADSHQPKPLGRSLSHFLSER